MAGVFQNIDSPPFGAGGGHTRWLERGVAGHILEDVRHSSILYVYKYFVVLIIPSDADVQSSDPSSAGASTKRPLLRTLLPYITVLVCVLPCIIYS